MNRFHYAASRELEPSFFRIAFPVTAFSIPKPATGRRENVSLTQLIYNMLKNSPTESFFQKFFFIFSFRRAYARQTIQISAFSQQTQSSAASLYAGYSFPLGEQQKPLPVLCTSSGTKSSTGISLNLSRFLIFLHIFFPPYRCIGIFLNLSLSALIPDGREEQSVCSVLVAPCIRSSSCSFLIAVVVASSINANLSLSIFFFFLSVCSLVSLLLHIQYARILRCGYFFADFFLCGEFVGKTRNLDGNLDYIQKSKAALVAKRFLPHENEIARLNIMREQGVQSNSQFIAGCKFTGFR